MQNQQVEELKEEGLIIKISRPRTETQGLPSSKD